MSTENEYKTRQEAKREYFLKQAEKNRRESEERAATAHRMQSFIPLGQPILVDHYSARRHRKDLDRIGSNIHKAIEAEKKAEYYERKAANVGNEWTTEDEIQRLEEILASNCGAAKKQRTRKRLEVLRAFQERGEGQEMWSSDGWKVREDLTEDRVLFTFDFIPAPETRTLLKRNGFKWSPTRKAWVCMAHTGGWNRALCVVREFWNQVA